MAEKGRILDREFEEGIANRVSDIQEEAQRDINKAQKFARKKEDEAEVMIKEHPVAFVLGAFLGGVIVGAMIAKRG